MFAHVFITSVALAASLVSLSACSTGAAVGPTPAVPHYSMITTPARQPTPRTPTTRVRPTTPEAPEPSPAVDEVEGWVGEADGICNDAIADYQAVKKRVGTSDPVALQVAASVATSRAATRIRALGSAPDSYTKALVTAIAEYAAAERELAVAWDKGLFDTTAQDQELERAGASLSRSAEAVGADACAAWVQRL